MVDLMEPEMAAPVAASVFPALVRSPDGAVAFQRVRAVLTPRWLVIYDERTVGGRRTVYTAHKVPHTGMRPHPKRAGAWIVETEEGEWFVDRGSGCGCSSPLKHMPSPAPLDL